MTPKMIGENANCFSARLEMMYCPAKIGTADLWGRAKMCAVELQFFPPAKCTSKADCLQSGTRNPAAGGKGDNLQREEFREVGKRKRRTSVENEAIEAMRK